MKLFIALLLLSSSIAQAQLFESMTQGDTFSGYVFVSLEMPENDLVSIAADASRTGMTLVLNGYMKDDLGHQERTQKRVLEINRMCCGEKGGAHWQINPPLYDKYQVKWVPTFLIAKNAGNGINDYSKVSGTMSIPIALRYFYQNSRIPEVQKKSEQVYARYIKTQ